MMGDLTIIINGVEQQTDKLSLTYEEVQELAGVPVDTVTFRNAYAGADGILHPGESLNLANNCIINAVATSYA